MPGFKKHRRFLLDVESTSEVDLRKVGAAAYWAHPSTQIIWVCYRVDDGPVIKWRPGDSIPYFVPELNQGHFRVVAHNWLFEFYAWYFHLNLIHGWVFPEPRIWDCTMARASYWGLPMGLGDLCEALNLPVQKDASARSLMLRMSKPRSLNPTVWWHETDPEKLKDLGDYCETDVLAECAADDALPELPDREREIFLMDGEINMRGVMIDLPMVKELGRITALEGGRLNRAMAMVTGLRVNTTNQVAEIGAVLAAEGCPVPDLTRATVAAMLARTDLNPRARKILALRQEAAKASTAKLSAMLAGADTRDAKCRGLLQYGGAGRTLRWAGRRVQPQNYPRGTLKGLSSVFAMVEAGASVDELSALLPGTVMDAVSSMLRGCMIPSPGYVFASGDLSQIEARVLPWLAGQDDVLAVFARGEDVYAYTAAKLGSNNRQFGKVLVLACIAEGEPVLTDQGLVPIELVTKAMRVWDGVEWVSHDGVVCRGEKEVIEHDGLRATPDHLVWTEGRSDPVPFGDAASKVDRLVRSGIGGTPLRFLGSDGPDIRPNRRQPSRAVPLCRLWRRAFGGLAKPAAGRDQGLSVPIPAEHEPLSRNLDAERGPVHDGRPGQVPEPKKPELEQLRGPGNYLRLPERPGGGRLGHSELGRTLSAETGTGPGGQQQGLRTGQSSLGDAVNAELQPAKTRVYDIVNAGPRHRFTVSGRLCHNCGFGMGPPRFQETAATYGVMLDLSEAEEGVYGWRDNNQKIVALWWAVDRAFRTVAAGPHGCSVQVGKYITIRKTRKAVRIVLPAPDKELTYQNVELVADGEFQGRDEITYMGVHPKTKKWVRLRTYGGKLVENIVQAVARDVMAESMLAQRRKKVRIVLTVHDELLVELPEATAPAGLNDLLKDMRTTPAWAPGLPCAAEGWTGKRYRK